MVTIKEYYRYSELLNFECSTCCNGRFTGDEKKVISRETVSSRKWAEENGHYAHEYVARFTSTFICSNPKCSETIFVSGIEAIDEDYETGPNGQFEAVNYSMYKPLYINPPIYLILINDSYPEVIKKELLNAFTVFWTDASACGNRIRVCVENLLVHFKIARFTIKKKFKMLDTRIKEFKTKYPQYALLADNLLAIKWIGNTASHEEISRKEVATAFEILSFVLDEIFHNRKNKIDKISKAIIKAKGKRIK
jgi:Domain of unknown function (DUF4145)